MLMHYFIIVLTLCRRWTDNIIMKFINNKKNYHNSIVHSNGSRLFSAGRPSGTRKNSVHCLWFLCCCTQTLHRTPFGTSSYFTHVDVCFGFLITALLCKLRVDINHQSADLENGWLAHVTSRVVQPRYRTQYWWSVKSVTRTRTRTGNWRKCPEPEIFYCWYLL